MSRPRRCPSVEADHLFTVVRDLSSRGVGIVYISHRLEEVARIATRVTVMRDGMPWWARRRPIRRKPNWCSMLVGRPFADLFPPRATKIRRPVRSSGFDHAAFDPRDMPAGGLAGTRKTCR